MGCKNDVTQKAVISCDKNKRLSEKLISVETAKELIDASIDVLLIEVSKPEQFTLAHIPGAVNIWRPMYRSKAEDAIRGQRCSKKELENLLGDLGMRTGTTILLYDRKGLVEASRLAWLFDLYGFENYKLINGGIKAWAKAGYEQSAGPSPEVMRTQFTLESKIAAPVLAETDEVKRAISDSKVVLVDTREPYEYLGQPFIANGEIQEYKNGAQTFGCIPSSVHLNWSELADLEGDHRIKCEKDLRYNLEQKGITPDKEIVVYCQSGSRSSHTAFVLQHLLGYPKVKNYDGSWIEWSSLHVADNSVEIEQITNTEKRREMIRKLEKTIAQESE